MKALRPLSLVVLLAISVLGQNTPAPAPEASSPHATEHAEQVARILGISERMGNLRAEQARTACGSVPTIEELSMRQEISETIMAASLDVDGVLAEIDNESAHLMELRDALEARRNSAVNTANAASLVTGSGVGVAVNAMQLSNSTADIGDVIGVGSGIASTALSIVGIRRQRGSRASVGRVPNMLAPLFGRPAVLNAYYPPSVLDYLRSVPPGQSPSSGSRLDQLTAEWRQAGQLGPPAGAKNKEKLVLLTSSMNPNVKVTIDDLNDRIAMLSDVRGRVALMKRDLAELLMSLRAQRPCKSE
jgi:hypothetical protein